MYSWNDFINDFPYTNFSDINVSWFLNKFKQIFDEWEGLYNQMLSWKTATDEYNATWREQQERAFTTWENNFETAIDAWKTQTESDIGTWETDTIASLEAWKAVFITQYNALKLEVEQIAVDAEAAKNSAQASATSAANSAIDAHNSALSIQASSRQINNNKKTIEKAENVNIVDYNLTGYYRTDSSIINIDNTPTSDNTYICAIIDCSENDIFTITAIGGNVARPWAFIDSSNNRLTFASSATSNNEIVVAPQNANKLVINAKINEYNLAIKGTFKISEKKKVYLNLPESLSSISSIVNNLFNNNEIDTIEISPGTYKVYTTINIPDGKTLILQGDYHDNGTASTILVPIQNNTTLLTLGDNSTLKGGIINLSTFAGCIAIKLDCHKTKIEYSSVVKTKIIGGRETNGNNVFNQTGVLIECDYASSEQITTHGYMQFNTFDIEIRSIGIGYRFHRQNAFVDTSNSVWLTNNDIKGLIYRCTRYIWFDMADGNYANNGSTISADFQSGALYVSQSEQAYPGINVKGTNILISGHFWDFISDQQNPHSYPAVFFDESSSGCILLDGSATVTSWQLNNNKLTTNTTLKELNAITGFKRVTLSRFSALITNFNNASYRIGDILFLRMQFKIAENETIPVNTSLIEMLNEDPLNMSYFVHLYKLNNGEYVGTLKVEYNGTSRRTFIKNLTPLVYSDAQYLDGLCIALSNRIESYSL